MHDSIWLEKHKVQVPEDCTKWLTIFTHVLISLIKYNWTRASDSTTLWPKSCLSLSDLNLVGFFWFINVEIKALDWD